ncbi:putative transporter [Ogataea parapolymorpha DL-1]|uniref:Transporter n=1 Tax=Ogataea parapolymorpha (strain ATCC 26012 / BCRC 20466 / JCM 22074 / NRRL Y-7560 / DL-1) TaxID=871575 RepID=W1QHG8_OGAPD|nr:putative transporter [Ogataea parapolymorpha DL-1]ESX01754.1 putative transporter [Ogataea parapolymorpha DL-1]
MIIDPDSRARYDTPQEEDDQPVHARTSFKLEMEDLIRNSLPTLLTFLLQSSLLLIIPIYFAGKQGKDVLSASSMAITLFYITGPALVFGFCTAEDTLCSTAFGAKSYTKVGLYYQRCMLILHMMFIPIALLWINSGPLLRVFSPELADMCVPILRLMVLAIPALIVFECSKRYLLSQNKFRAPTMVLLGALPFSLIFNTAFKTFYLGPALSLVLTYWTVCMLVVTYIYFDDHQCWNSDLRPSVLLQDWGQFSIGLSGIVMVCAESFSFRVITLLSAKFGSVELASQTVVTTISMFLFQFPFSFGICSSVRLANYIGARSHNCVTVMRVATVATAVIGLINFSIMFFFRGWLPHIFTDDEEVIKFTANLLRGVAFNEFGDAVNAIFSSLLRGQGRQNIGSVLNLTAYYMIAIPLELLFGFYFGLGVAGLWVGFLLGELFLSAAEVYLIWSTNWDGLIEKNQAIV